MPRVFTIYNCGTCHNRQNLDETVANLASRTSGAENRDWMINDGPGSFSRSVKSSASAHERGLAAQAHVPGNNGSCLAMPKGIVDGYGWEQNVEHTMALLNATIDLPQVINMTGWSRGAITCFMIAYALHENPRTRSIEVNIFAFDPVPGPGNFDDPHKVTLPPNVKSYAAVVQQDDRRKIFRPTLITPDEAPGVKTKFYYMPGIHSTGVFRLQNEVGLIAAFLAHKFLQKHGTQLTSAIQLSPKDICELYGKVRLNIASYRNQHGGIMQVLGVAKRKTQDNFRDTAYFVNEHHAHQFRKAFPEVWWALEKGVTPANQTVFDRGLSTLRSFAPTTFLSLQKSGILAA